MNKELDNARQKTAHKEFLQFMFNIKFRQQDDIKGILTLK